MTHKHLSQCCSQSKVSLSHKSVEENVCVNWCNLPTEGLILHYSLPRDARLFISGLLTFYRHFAPVQGSTQDARQMRPNLRRAAAINRQMSKSTR